MQFIAHVATALISYIKSYIFAAAGEVHTLTISLGYLCFDRGKFEKCVKILNEELPQFKAR